MNTRKFDLQTIRHNAEMVLEGYAQQNKPDRCNALIYCCIEAGMNTGNEIVGSVHWMAPDLKKSFIGLLLNKPLKPETGEPFWRKDPVAGYVVN